MLEIVGSSLMGLWLAFWGNSAPELEPLELLLWQEAAIFNVPTQSDATVEEIVRDYRQRLSARGFIGDRQGVWIQTDWAELADLQGQVAIPAASITKVATTLAILEQWETQHRFETKIYRVGRVTEGVLEGDLIVEGSGDPLFVWEEAIAIGNYLQRLGIQRVTGNLIVLGKFYMNYNFDPLVSARFFREAINARTWSSAAAKQYAELPAKTPRPQIIIGGTLKGSPTLPANAQLLLRHQSLTLGDILKQMNIYSNNKMAEMFAQSLGGGAKVAQIAANAAGVPPAEIQLINGSGLGTENRVSPRAACAMFIAIERKLEASSLSVSDLFPVAGRDRGGTMIFREIPQGTTVKTGTLNQVSALAGLLPTQERGKVWFAIINHGTRTEQLRREQDRLLQRLAQHWQVKPNLANDSSQADYLGNPDRNLPVISNQ